MEYSTMPLGRTSVTHDARIPMVAKFMTSPYAFPANYDMVGGKGIAWGMMLNDTLGDCTIAGVGHKCQADTALASVLWTATDTQILSKYEAWDGYHEGVTSTDQGGVEANVLADWYKNSFFGHKLYAYGYIDQKNHDEVRHFCAEANGLYIGVALPVSAQTQDVWGEGGQGGDSTAGSWGGHCVYVYGYTSDSAGNLATIKFISWGKEMEMTVAFWDAYVDEAWVCLTADLIEKGKTPAGLNLTALKAELDKLPKQ